jgi:AraC-like DNA-binding protein
MLISEITLITGFIVLCYWIIYKAVTHPVVLLTDYSAQKSAINISPSLKNEYVDKLLKYMTSEKPYLRPELTLNELADLVTIPPRTLSDILNKVLNKTFYDFINGYRIKEAQNRIENSYDKETILEILYKVGFNSKSSFNTMFKKNTGLTPTQYKTKIFHEN